MKIKTNNLDRFSTYDPGDKVFTIVTVTISLSMLVIALFPMWFVLIASISDQDAVYAGQVWFFPVRPNIDGYRKILEDARILTGYRNTIFYTVLGVSNLMCNLL